MAIPIAAGTTLSVAANSDSAQLVTGDYEFIGKGRLVLVAKASVTGMKINLSCGGTYLANKQAVPFFGATGSLDTVSNVAVSQLTSGGRVQLTFTNTTAGAVTVDYVLFYEAM